MAWFSLNHVTFGIVFGALLLTVSLMWVARDGFRQTHPASLMARGITPESVLPFSAMACFTFRGVRSSYY